MRRNHNQKHHLKKIYNKKNKDNKIHNPHPFGFPDLRLKAQKQKTNKLSSRHLRTKVKEWQSSISSLERALPFHGCKAHGHKSYVRHWLRETCCRRGPSVVIPTACQRNCKATGCLEGAITRVLAT